MVKPLTTEQTKELERLNDSEYVKLARREARLIYKQRQQLYSLRCLEKRGRQLAAEGITLDNINRQIEEIEQSDEEATA